MDNFINLHEGFDRLRPPVQVILGLTLLVLVLGMVILPIVVAINPGSLASVVTILNTIASMITLLIIIGSVMNLLNKIVNSIVLRHQK
jgi:hypothetical protein